MLPHSITATRANASPKAMDAQNTSSAAISTSCSPKRFNGAKNSKNSVHSRPRGHARRDRPGDRMSHHEVAVKVVHEYRFQFDHLILPVPSRRRGKSPSTSLGDFLE